MFVLAIFRKIVNRFKREIQLNKEYYESLREESAEPQQGVEREVQPAVSPTIKSDKSFDPHIHVRTDTYTVYYAYGHVQKVFPPPNGSYYDNRDIIYGATFIVSDGVAYDLTDKKSIYSIKVPNYHIYAPNKVGEELGVTGCLDYVLRMRAGQFWNESNIDLAIACLEKATELMKHSSIGWPKKDFYRIVDWLNELGKFKKAQAWREWIDRNIPDIEEVVSRNVLQSCDFLDTDLVIVEDNCNMCCEMCAMYRKRVYSISGKDHRFHKFPDNFHLDCGLSVHPFVEGVSEPSSFECKNIIKYSNRPFVDDRTHKEIERHQSHVEMLESMERREKEASLSKIIYYRLRKILPPEDVPKSLGGFSRMRNANSKNYQALVKKAEAAGFVFPQSLDDVVNWQENQ